MSSLLRSPSRAESSQLVLKYVSKESGCGWVAGGGAGTLPWCLLELLLPSLPPSLLSFWICKRPCSSHLLMVLAPATGSRIFFLPHEGRPIVWLLGRQGSLGEGVVSRRALSQSMPALHYCTAPDPGHPTALGPTVALAQEDAVCVSLHPPRCLSPRRVVAHVALHEPEPHENEGTFVPHHCSGARATRVT